MKLIFFLAAMAAVTIARPQEPAKAGIIPIINYRLNRDDHGQYALNYVTGDGIKVTEEGALVENANRTGHVLVKKGSFSYFAPDGTLIEETWTADAEGFRAMGDHLPKPPPPPSA